MVIGLSSFTEILMTRYWHLSAEKFLCSSHGLEVLMGVTFYLGKRKHLV